MPSAVSPSHRFPFTALTLYRGVMKPYSISCLGSLASFNLSVVRLLFVHLFPAITEGCVLIYFCLRPLFHLVVLCQKSRMKLSEQTQNRRGSLTFIPCALLIIMFKHSSIKFEIKKWRKERSVQEQLCAQLYLTVDGSSEHSHPPAHWYRNDFGHFGEYCTSRSVALRVVDSHNFFFLLSFLPNFGVSLFISRVNAVPPAPLCHMQETVLRLAGCTVLQCHSK